MSAVTAENLQAWLADFAREVNAHAAELTDLDREIGDADHGANMDRGMKAVVALDASSLGSGQAYLKKVGMTLVSTVGGASGPLYGTFFLRCAGALPDGEADLDVAAWADVLQAGVDGVQQRGKAAPGDKTMLDALLPALDAFRAAGDVATAWSDAAAAAAQGRDATRAFVARKGRASYLGERAVGHIDPGAASATLLLEAGARTFG